MFLLSSALGFPTSMAPFYRRPWRSRAGGRDSAGEALQEARGRGDERLWPVGQHWLIHRSGGGEFDWTENRLPNPPPRLQLICVRQPEKPCFSRLCWPLRVCCFYLGKVRLKSIHVDSLLHRLPPPVLQSWTMNCNTGPSTMQCH